MATKLLGQLCALFPFKNLVCAQPARRLSTIQSDFAFWRQKPGVFLWRVLDFFFALCRGNTRAPALHYDEKTQEDRNTQKKTTAGVAEFQKRNVSALTPALLHRGSSKEAPQPSRQAPRALRLALPRRLGRSSEMRLAAARLHPKRSPLNGTAALASPTAHLPTGRHGIASRGSRPGAPLRASAPPVGHISPVT